MQPGVLDARTVVARAQLGRQRRGVEFRIDRAQRIQRALKRVEVAHALVLDGGVVFAALAPLAVDAVCAHEIAQGGDGEGVEAHLAPALLRRAGVVRFGQIVRQVDDEAGVAPRGAVADPLGLDERDFAAGQALGQPAGGGEAGEPGPQHHDVEPLRAAHAHRRRRRRQDVIPAAGLIVVGQLENLHDPFMPSTFAPVNRAGEVGRRRFHEKPPACVLPIRCCGINVRPDFPPEIRRQMRNRGPHPICPICCKRCSPSARGCSPTVRSEPISSPPD